MTGLDIFDYNLEYTFSDNWRARLERELALLLSTRAGSMPLDRAFGIEMDFLDLPTELAKSLYAAQITEKIPQFIPSVRVEEVSWRWNGNGKLSPKVVITSA